MAKYLLISSRDPFESNDAQFCYDLAGDLAKENEVTLFLVQNGVLPARQCSQSSSLTNLAEAGVQVLADDFSLHERGIGSQRLAKGVTSASLDVLVDQLANGCKAIWH